jgi:hypothetical protein
MKAVKVKQTAMTSIGQSLASSKDEFEKAFDKILDLILVATGLKPFRDDTGLLMYRKLVTGTRLKVKDPNAKRDQIEKHVRPYRKLFEAYRTQIVQEDLSFIMETDIDIVTGNSKTAKLPLSKVYEYCLKNDDEALANLEANLYFIFKYLCDEKNEEADHKALAGICDQFQIEEDTSRQDVVSNIVSKVRNSAVAKGGEQPSMEQVGSIVQALIGDGDMQNNMGGLATDLLSGKLTIPALIAQVKSSVEASQGSEKGKEEETE